jgi:hypothetical protein
MPRWRGQSAKTKNLGELGDACVFAVKIQWFAFGLLTEQRVTPPDGSPCEMKM